MGDDKFKVMPDSPAVTPPVPDDPTQYGPADPTAPNSVLLKIGKRSFVSWQSDNPIAVLALMMMTMLIVALLLICVLLTFSSAIDKAGLGKLGEVMGQAILTIVGAIIGSSASSRARKK